MLTICLRDFKDNEEIEARLYVRETKVKNIVADLDETIKYIRVSLEKNMAEQLRAKYASVAGSADPKKW